MTPQRMPTNSFSACWQIFASATGSNGRPEAVKSAWATLTSSAADELKPEPIGTSVQTTQSAPARRRPLLSSITATPNAVVGPVVAAARRRRVEIEFARLVHDHRIDGETPVGPGRSGGEGGELERRRHDEAVVVVGVFADEVDPAGRAADLRHAAEAEAELLRHVARQTLMSAPPLGEKRRLCERARQAPFPGCPRRLKRRTTGAASRRYISRSSFQVRRGACGLTALHVISRGNHSASGRSAFVWMRSSA